MKFFKNLIKKKNEELSPEEIEHVNNSISGNNKTNNYNNDSNSSNNPEEEKLYIRKIINQLNNLEEINRLRNLLDDKEREITGNHDLYKPEEEKEIEQLRKDLEKKIEKEKSNKKFEEKKTSNEKFFGEINIDEKLDDENLDSETYHVDDYKKEIKKIEEENNDKITKEVEFIEDSEKEDYDDNNYEQDNFKKISQKEIISEEEDYEINEENKKQNEKYIEIHHEDEDEFGNDIDKDYLKIIKEIREIFKIENIIETTGETCEFDSINGETINYIGIRNKNAFSNDMSVEDENAWFITRIKKLEELKKFKMLKSEAQEKDLVWIRDDYPTILISFRTTNSLENQDDFPFPM